MPAPRAAGIHHEENPVAQIGEHEIIQNAAAWRCQQPIALPPRLEARNISGRQSLQRRRRAFAAQFGLSHVGDIEQRRGAPAMQMLRHDAGRVLHGQRITREAHHAPAQFAVQRGKRGFRQGFGLGLDHAASRCFAQRNGFNTWSPSV